MKKMIVLALLMFSVSGCASADTIANLNSVEGPTLSLSQAKAQVLKDPSSLDMLQPFGKFSWDDGVLEVVAKLKAMGVTDVVINKAVGETIPIDFLVEMEGDNKYFGEKFDGQELFSVYPVIIDNIPFELEFFMDDSPWFGVLHPERVIKTRRGNSKALHIEQVRLNLVSANGDRVNVEGVTTKILKKYQRFVKDGDFTNSAPKIGNFTDRFGNFFYANGDGYGYSGSFYKNALEQKYKTYLSEKQKEQFKNLKDMGSDL